MTRLIDAFTLLLALGLLVGIVAGFALGFWRGRDLAPRQRAVAVCLSEYEEALLADALRDHGQYEPERWMPPFVSHD